MKKQKINNTESGRSMVEMLGVLAIMGVLSVGGIAGYQYAMNKYRANTLINDLSRRAAVVSTQRVGGRQATLSEFDGETPLYPISLASYAPDTASFFALRADHVPEEVCRLVLSEKSALVSGVFQDSIRLDSAEGCLDNTSLMFVYQNELKQDASVSGDENACLESCPSGSVNPVCAAGEKRKATGKTACAQACYECLDDTCPAGTERDGCGARYDETYHSTTAYGTSCYTCTYVGVILPPINSASSL